MDDSILFDAFSMFQPGEASVNFPMTPVNFERSESFEPFSSFSLTNNTKDQVEKCIFDWSLDSTAFCRPIQSFPEDTMNFPLFFPVDPLLQTNQPWNEFQQECQPHQVYQEQQLHQGYQEPQHQVHQEKQESGLKVLNFKTIATTSSRIRIPSSIDEAQQCIVDALSLILPIDAKVTIFGFNYSVILVGVLYRHDNLSWIMLNRANLKLYLVCHFVSDGIHLFESMRSKLNQPLKQTDKIWSRQGVPEILLLFESYTDLKNNNAFRINQLPKEIIKFSRTPHSFQKTIEFLRGVGSGGMFLQRYIRKQPLPFGFSPIISGLTEGTRGWKVFNPSRSMSGKCFGGKRQTCCVDFVQSLMDESFEKLQDFEQAVLISTILPTRMDDSKNRALSLHYEAFINNIRKEQQNHSFFPSVDVYYNKN